jgi:hypothetical protein
MKRVTAVRVGLAMRRVLPTLSGRKVKNNVINALRGRSRPEVAASPARRLGRCLGAAGLLWLGLVPALANVHRKAGGPARPPAAASSAATAASAPAATTTDLAQWCGRLAPTVPGIDASACRASGLVPGAGRSVRGVPLWADDVLPASGAPRFKVLLLGGIHGDELASVTLAFDWIARSRGVKASARPRPPTGAKPTIADVGWRFVPLLNPDGLLHSPTGRATPSPTGSSTRSAIRAASRARRRSPSPNRAGCCSRSTSSTPT